MCGVCCCVWCVYINQDVIGDRAEIEDWSKYDQISNNQSLDLPRQASQKKQSESLGG